MTETNTDTTDVGAANENATNAAAPDAKSFNKDSINNTLAVALVLCLVCSFLVSAAAVSLKSLQDSNVERDRKKNILQVTGFNKEEFGSGSKIEKLFNSRFETMIFNVATGEVVDESDPGFQTVIDEMKLGSFDEALNRYDPITASKSKKKKLADPVDKAKDIAQIKYLEKYSLVYILKDDKGVVQKYVLPVRGYGLWSMLKGYLALEPDMQSIAGLTFFEHKETPGLGGEVDNPKWKANWKQGKKLYGKDGDVKIKVVKGISGDDPYGVDGLSGATITSKGVSMMLKYWMGPNGFGPFIENLKSQGGSAAVESNTQGGLDG